MTQPEGQTARDVFPEDEGIPEVAQDDSPTQERAEDPQFAPLPGERANASADFGTTALEQSEGESLDGRLARELPDDAPDVRPAEDPDRAVGQLEQDTSTTPDTDSGTNRTADDVEATADPSVGGEGPGAGRHARHRRLTPRARSPPGEAPRVPSGGRVGVSRSRLSTFGNAVQQAAAVRPGPVSRPSTRSTTCEPGATSPRTAQR